MFCSSNVVLELLGCLENDDLENEDLRPRKRKVKIWEIFTFRRRCSIDLLINVNLRYMYPARYLHLLFLRYFHNAVYKTVSRIFKVARYSFSGSIPPKFEHKLRRQKLHVKSASFSTDNSRTPRLSIFYRISNHKIFIPKYFDNALTDFA